MSQPERADWYLPAIEPFTGNATEPQGLDEIDEYIQKGALRPEHPLGRYAIGVRRADEFPQVRQLFDRHRIMPLPKEQQPEFDPKMIEQLLMQTKGKDVSPRLNIAGRKQPGGAPKAPRLSELQSRSRKPRQMGSEAQTSGLRAPKNPSLPANLLQGEAKKSVETGRFYLNKLKPDAEEPASEEPSPTPEPAPELVHEWHLPQLPEFGKKSAHPQTLHNMIKLINEGILAPDHEVRRGDSPAVEAGRFPELATIFEDVYPNFVARKEDFYTGEEESAPAEEEYDWGEVAEVAPDRAKSVVEERGALPVPEVVTLRSDAELGLKPDEKETNEAASSQHVNALYGASKIGIVAGLVSVLPSLWFMFLSLPDYVAHTQQQMILRVAADFGVVALAAIALGIAVSHVAALIHCTLQKDMWEYLLVVLPSVALTLALGGGLSLAGPGSAVEKLEAFQSNLMPLYWGLAGVIVALVVFQAFRWFESNDEGFLDYRTGHASGQMKWTVLGFLLISLAGAANGYDLYQSHVEHETILAGITGLPGMSVYGVEMAPYDTAEREITVRGYLYNRNDEVLDPWFFDVMLFNGRGELIDQGRVINEGFIQFRGRPPGEKQIPHLQADNDPESVLRPGEKTTWEVTFTALEDTPETVQVRTDPDEYRKLQSLYDQYMN